MTKLDPEYAQLSNRIGYFPKYAPEHFFGRDDDITNLVKTHFTQGESVIITGKRRIGRSWLLKHLSRALEADPRFIIPKDGGVSADIYQNPVSLFRHLLDALRKAIEQRLALRLVAPAFNQKLLANELGAMLHQEIAALNDTLAQHKAKPMALLLIDEIEGINSESFSNVQETLTLLKSIAERYSQFCLVLAGMSLLPNPRDPGLSRVCKPYQLYGMGANGARAFLVDRLEAHGIRFADVQCWEMIEAATGLEPMLLRLLGPQLVLQAAEMKRDRATEHDGSIALTQLHIRQALPNVLRDAQLKTTWSLGAFPPGYLWQVLERHPDGDRKIELRLLLGLLAHHLPEIGTEQTILFDKVRRVKHLRYSERPMGALDNDLDYLSRMGVLYSTATQTGPVYRFSSKLLQLWLQREIIDPGI